MKQYLFIITFCCFSIQNFTQSKTFHLGLKAEFYGYTSREVREYNAYTKKFSFSPLPSMYVIASKNFSESFSIVLKPGVIFVPDKFGVLELGVFLNHMIDKDKFFVLGGINTHFVNEPDYRRDASKIIYFLFLGVGYQLTERLSVDISFHQTLNKEFGYTYAKLPSDASGPSELYNMIKVGFAASL